MNTLYMSHAEALPTVSSTGYEQPGTISHLLAPSQQHRDRIGPYLERMCTEDIGMVAAEAFVVIEEET